MEMVGFKFKQHPHPHTLARKHTFICLQAHSDASASAFTPTDTGVLKWALVHLHTNTHLCAHFPSLDRPDGGRFFFFLFF